MSKTGFQSDGRRFGLLSMGMAIALVASVLLIQASHIGRQPISGELRLGRLSIRLDATGSDSHANGSTADGGLAQRAQQTPAAEADIGAGSGGDPASSGQPAGRPAEAGSRTAAEPEQVPAAGQQEGSAREKPPGAGREPHSEQLEPEPAQGDPGQSQELEQAPSAGEQQPEESQSRSADGEAQNQPAEAEAQPQAAEQPSEVKRQPETGEQPAEVEEQPQQADQAVTGTEQPQKEPEGQEASQGELLGPEDSPEGGDQLHVLEPSGGVFSCKDSGFCSVGQVRAWHGDVATNEAAREMLEAVAYKKEVGRVELCCMCVVVGGRLFWLACSVVLQCIAWAVPHIWTAGMPPSGMLLGA
jgi:hypothetical protein